MNRREFCKKTSALALIACSGATLFAAEEQKVLTVQEAIAKFTGGKGSKQSIVVLSAPEIAENGLVVPLKVSVEMETSNPLFPKKIHLIAPGNPVPHVCSMSISKRNGRAYMSTRVKLAKSQEIIALVELGNGTFVHDSKMVKVTIGGCG